MIDYIRIHQHSVWFLDEGINVLVGYSNAKPSALSISAHRPHIKTPKFFSSSESFLFFYQN